MLSIKCYDCVKDHKSQVKVKLTKRFVNYFPKFLSLQPCPGKLVDFVSSRACRIEALSDNTIVKQVDQK